MSLRFKIVTLAKLYFMIQANDLRFILLADFAYITVKNYDLIIAFFMVGKVTLKAYRFAAAVAKVCLTLRAALFVGALILDFHEIWVLTLNKNI